ncbi:MAG: hypothetical protein R3358_12090 [Woeseiaceae bacterium]|nr:hypothetical protein [Woeseiaceae bacterium]
MGGAAGRQLVPNAGNSTATPLSASATFTGTAVDVLGYAQVHLVYYQEPNVTPNGDGDTAKGSLYFEFSPDGTNWDISVPVFVRSGINIPQTLVVVDRYFRVRYINDGGAAAITSLGLGEAADTARNQTAFRMNTYLVPYGTKELGRTLDQSVSGSDPVSLTRGVVMGLDPDGATYKNVALGDAGEFQVTRYSTEVSRGNLSGKVRKRVHGRNPNVGNSAEAIWENGGAYNFLTAASAIRVQAGGNAADTSAGAGARTLRVTGLDANGDEQTSDITLAGASASSATAETYLRVNRVEVLTVGTYGQANTGAITIETTGGTVLAVVAAGLGLDQLGVYSVPNGKKGYLHSIGVSVEGNFDADVFIYCRENLDDTSAPMSPRLRVITLDQVAGGAVVTFPIEFPIEVAGKADIWAEAVGSVSGNAIAVTLNMEVIDD